MVDDGCGGVIDCAYREQLGSFWCCDLGMNRCIKNSDGQLYAQ